MQSKMIKTEKLEKINWWLANVVFPLLLLLYPLRHICFGLEWWDTGYNYGNFTYIDKMDSMWMFSTYLANVMGNLLTRLPLGDTMLGLNLYTGLTVSGLALAGYYFFRNRIKIPPVIVFLGEMIAIGLCWCPTALLYNYLTYLLMFGGVYCLYRALTEEKNLWFILAGICLGINVFVRFSNLAQMALIVAVWAYAIIKKKKWNTTVAWTLWCILGYVLGLGVFFGYICIRYGAGEYIGAIQRLFGMTTDASDYTMYSMVLYQLQNYRQNLIWLHRMLPFVAVGVAGFAVLPGRLARLKKAGFVCGMALVFYWLRNQNMFNMKYSTKLSVFQWAVCLLTFTMLFGAWTILRKKATAEEKLLCGLAMIIAVITPLGSNNHLYSSINNLFFGAPVILWILWKWLKELPGMYALQIVGKKLCIYSYPVKATVVMIVGMLAVQSIGFGFGYVFSESDGGENLNTRMEGSDRLAGIYTEDIRAEQLETLLTYTQEQGLTGQELILYGNIPALSYYLEMPFAISSWPDLKSYNYEVMQRDMESLRERIAEGEAKPVLLLEASYGTYMLEGENGLEALQLGEAVTARILQDEKLVLLMEFARDYGYVMKFSNDKFMLFTAG